MFPGNRFLAAFLLPVTTSGLGILRLLGIVSGCGPGLVLPSLLTWASGLKSSALQRASDLCAGREG